MKIVYLWKWILGWWKDELKQPELKSIILSHRIISNTSTH